VYLPYDIGMHVLTVQGLASSNTGALALRAGRHVRVNLNLLVQNGQPLALELPQADGATQRLYFSRVLDSDTLDCAHVTLDRFFGVKPKGPYVVAENINSLTMPAKGQTRPREYINILGMNIYSM
jgi:hypothetical protein